MEIDRRRLAEPVLHPECNELFTLWEEPPNSGNVIVDGPLASSFYSREDVLKLGLGDFNVGVTRIGQATYKSSYNDLLMGREKALMEELRD